MTRRSSRVWQKAMPNHPQRRRLRQRGCHSGPWSFLTNGSEPANGLSLIILIGLFTNETLPELLEKSLETARLTDSGWVDVGYELGSSAGCGIDWLTFEDARASVVDDVRRIREHPRCFVLRTTLRILKTNELMRYRPRRSVEPRGAYCGSVDYTVSKDYPKVRPRPLRGSQRNISKRLTSLIAYQ